MKIVILSNSSNRKLVETAKKRGHDVRVLKPEKFYMYISEHERGYDRLYYGDKGNEPERITANSIDCVINRIGRNRELGVSILQFMTENLGIYCPNLPEGITIAANKARTLQRLSSAGVKVPRTIVCENPTHVKWIVESIGDVPIIIKTLYGSQGKTVAIVYDKKTANSVFEFVYNNHLKVLIEEYIDAGGTDYRCWVVGDNVPIVMKRSSDSSFKANISLGGHGERAELSKELKEMCVKAAHSIGLNVAGVDLMISKKGVPYIIEINSNPGTKIIKLCNYNPFEDIIKFCEYNYKKGNNLSNSVSMETLCKLFGNELKTAPKNVYDEFVNVYLRYKEFYDRQLLIGNKIYGIAQKPVF